MPALFILTLLVQGIFAYHAIQTNRTSPWLYLILLFPGIGCALYFFIEFLPEMRRNKHARRAAGQVLKTLDPERDLRRLADDLKRSDNVDNKLKLAEECLEQSLYSQAIELYESCRKGIYQFDPNIMAPLARAYFLAERFAEAKHVLDELIAHNPGYKSPREHLLYARTLAALGEEAKAIEEYEVLVDYYPGAEAKCRYALLLQQRGDTEKAHKFFSKIVEDARLAPAHYRKAQREWLKIAEQHLKDKEQAEHG